MMKNLSARLVTVLLPLIISACGGDGSVVIVVYDGTWRTNYNVVRDDCELFIAGTSQVQETYFISSDMSAISVDTESGLLKNVPGAIRADGALISEASEQQDLLGDGSLCGLSTAFTLDQSDDDTANALFRFRVDCGGEIRCSTEALGIATKTS